MDYAHAAPVSASCAVFDSSLRLLHFADPLVAKCQPLQTGALLWMLLQTGARGLFLQPDSGHTPADSPAQHLPANNNTSFLYFGRRETGRLILPALGHILDVVNHPASFSLILNNKGPFSYKNEGL